MERCGRLPYNHDKMCTTHHQQFLFQFSTADLASTIMTPTDSSAQLHLGNSLTSLANQPSTLRYAPGIHLTPLQQYHVCLVFDLFQAKGTWAKIEEGLAEDAVYEDLFATAKNRVEVGEYPFVGFLVSAMLGTYAHAVR